VQVLNAAEATNLAADLVKSASTEHTRLRRFVRYIRGRQKLPWLPDNVDTEYLDIARKSASNWLDLVLRSTTQGLYVDGYGDRTDEADVLWERAWQANGMDARQHALHQAAGTLGYSHLIVFPAADGVWMRPESAINMVTSFADPGDEWPEYAVRILDKGRTGYGGRFDLYDAEARYSIFPGGEVTVAPHGLGFCPVVEMRWAIDLLGTPMGEVEPVIPIQDRIVDATFTLQMVAKYGAFPQRWISGIDTSKPLVDAEGNVLTDGEGNPLFPTIKAYVDSILTATDPDTKFGQFQAADLRQYVDALDAHIKHLAAITQTPAHYLLGSMEGNPPTAEALSASESGLQRKISEKRMVLGEGYEQAMRAAAAILGMDAAAQDMASQVHWRDVESRSLAQVSDALLKLSQLGIPVDLLLPMVPGFSQQDVEEAKRLRSEGDALGQLVASLTSGMTASPPADPLA
jgi:hypothetical protein